MADWPLAYGDEIRRDFDVLDEEWMGRNGIQVKHTIAAALWGGGWVEDPDAPGGEAMSFQRGIVVVIHDNHGIKHAVLMTLGIAMVLNANLSEAIARGYFSEPVMPANPQEPEQTNG